MENESKFDKINEKFDNLKEDFSEMKTDIKLHMAFVENHIKTNNEFIEHLKPIIEDFQFEAEKAKRNKLNLQDWATKLGLLSVIIGIIVGCIKIF